MKIKFINIRCFIRKRILFNTMKSFIFLLCTTVFALNAENGFSQKEIKIDVDKEVSIDEVFKIIKKQTDYRFIYPEDLFKGLPKVQLKKGIIQLKQLLDNSLKGDKMSIEIEDNTILIKKPPVENTLKKELQEVQISGTVIDQTGQPLAGATVLIKDKGEGVITDFDGNFEIKGLEPGTYNLVFSYVGYSTLTQQVDLTQGNTVVNVTLKTDLLQMDEVVITGVGNVLRKKEITTPIASLSNAQIEAAPVSGVDGLLQGRIPGLRVNLNSGVPGSGARILNRGVVSTFGSTIPVIYIDGVRVDNGSDNTLNLGDGADRSSALADLTVDDIERVEVIKAGAASTLFGSDAGNGVIQIFTKRGKIGDAKITVRTETGFDQPITRWYALRFLKDETFKTGFSLRNSVNVQGGGEKGTYYLSLNQKKNTGIFDNLDQSTYSFQGGIKSNFSKTFKIDASFNYFYDNYGKTYSSFGSFGNGFLAAIDSGFWGINFKDDIYDSPSDLDLARSTFNDFLDGNNLRQNIHRTTASVTFLYKPFDFLDNRLTVGVNQRTSELRETIPVGSNPWIFYTSANGHVASSERDNTILTLDYSSSLVLEPFDNVKSTFTVGLQGFRQETNSTLRSGIDFGISGAEDLDGAAIQTIDENRIELFNGGFYLNEQLGIKDKLFLSLGARFDYNSSFGDDIGAQFYPKAGVSYWVSEENYWKDSFLSGIIDGLKLRASWGKSGKFPSPFAKDRTFATSPFIGAPSASFGSAGNDDLGPEVTVSTDLGFDILLLKNRLSFEFSYYTDNTFDAILNAPIDPVSGYTSRLINLGQIENKGVEIAMNAQIINSTNFQWNLGINYATVKNKVVDMGGVAPFSIGDFGSSMVMEGFPVGILSTNRPTAALDGTFETVFEKSIIPDKNGSINTSLTYKKLSLSANADWQTGGYFANTVSTWQFFFGGDLPGIVPPNYSWFTATDNFKDKSDYFSIREIYLSYDLGDLQFLKDIRLFGSIRNVHTFHSVRFENQNPETLQSFGDNTDLGSGAAFTISPPRQFRFGIKASFK